MPERFIGGRALSLPSAPRVWLPGKTTPYKRSIHVLRGWGTHRNREGAVLWDQGEWRSNILHDEGEQALLSAYFDTDLANFGAPPANLYLGLDDRAALAEGDTLAMVGFNEPDSTGGYAREAISTTTGFTLAQASTHYAATAAEVQFDAVAAGFEFPVTHAFLTTVVSGTSGNLICSLDLDAEREMAEGDSLAYTLSVGMHE